MLGCIQLKLENLEISKLENEGASARAVVARRAINFGKVCTPKSDTSELSEGNGEVWKDLLR